MLCFYARRRFISHKVYFRNQYTMKGLDDHITRFMYGRAAAQCTSCDAANIPLRRRVLFGPVDQQSVVSSYLFCRVAAGAILSILLPHVSRAERPTPAAAVAAADRIGAWYTTGSGPARFIAVIAVTFSPPPPTARA